MKGPFECGIHALIAADHHESCLFHLSLEEDKRVKTQRIRQPSKEASAVGLSPSGFNVQSFDWLCLQRWLVGKKSKCLCREAQAV